VHVLIAEEYCGPPTSGNGGYTAGLLAEYAGGTAEVTLRRPPPLDTPLEVVEVDGGARLLDGDDVVAEAVPVVLDVSPPPAVSWEEATRASDASMFRDERRHPFPTCFACGPSRGVGDGLRIFAGPVADAVVAGRTGRPVFAAPWVPTAATAPIVWAALDCPSSAPAFYDATPGPFVLGRIAARVDRLPEVGRRHVVTSAALGADGRKFHAVSAIRDPDGELCAVARATWIQIAPR
jgi:hypothetical protein